MFNISEGDVNDCENLGTSTRCTMYVMLDDRVIEDAVALFQTVGLLAINDFHLALHDVDELLALVG